MEPFVFDKNGNISPASEIYESGASVDRIRVHKPKRYNSGRGDVVTCNGKLVTGRLDLDITGETHEAAERLLAKFQNALTNAKIPDDAVLIMNEPELKPKKITLLINGEYGPLAAKALMLDHEIYMRTKEVESEGHYRRTDVSPRTFSYEGKQPFASMVSIPDDMRQDDPEVNFVALVNGKKAKEMETDRKNAMR